MNLADWYWSLQGVALFLLFVSFCVAALTLIASKRAAARDAERILVLETDLAKQRELTAKAQRDVLELRQKVQWRTLTSSERNTLRDALKAASAKGLVTLFLRDSRDEEAHEYATEIAHVLAESGWRYQVWNGSADLVPRDPIGLSIRVMDPTKPPQHGLVLKAALDSALGVDVPITRPPRGARNEADAVVLVIHPKRL